MQSMTFSWDERKDRKNQKKHGVSFSEAKTAFYDENARLTHDPDRSAEEDRFILLGFSASLRMLVVCHCYRERDRVIRIISARKAAKKEQRNYRENL
jgi:uncharacterized DUF497 family protein